MGSRTDWLTEFAQPVAQELAERCGSLKRVLSAGVLILKDASPEIREYYMAKSVGADLTELEKPDEEFRKRVSQIVQETIALEPKKKSVRRSKSAGA